MAYKTLAETVANWQSGSTAKSGNYAAGIAATTADVVGLAVAAQNAMVSNFSLAVSSGRWARQLQAVGTNGWKTITTQKAGNWLTGVTNQASINKYQSAMTTWLPIIDNFAAQAKAMPGGTTANRIARSQFFLTQLAAQKASGV
jgi:hypothetical protein